MQLVLYEKKEWKADGGLAVDKPFAELDLLLGSLQILFHEHEFSGNLLRQGGGRGIAGAWQGVSMVLSTHIVFWGFCFGMGYGWHRKKVFKISFVSG